MSGVANARLDVRRALLARGWTEDGTLGVLSKADVTVAYRLGSSVMVSGPARGRTGTATTELPDVPARVIVALCEAWAS